MAIKSKNIFWKAFAGLTILTLVQGFIIFYCAGSMGYWQGWLYLVVFTSCAAVITFYIWKRDPKLLQRRTRAGFIAEKEKTQQIIQAFANIAFLAEIGFPPLDHRFGWSHVPFGGVIIGNVLLALGFFFVFLVFKENTFAAATVEVDSDQKVITTGPYASVRHPMYVGGLLIAFGIPLALGSWWGLFNVLLMAFIIIWRLLEEEKLLLTKLQGYDEYCHKVRYRLLPHIW